jgi:hypothetical protein
MAPSFEIRKYNELGSISITWDDFVNLMEAGRQLLAHANREEIGRQSELHWGRTPEDSGGAQA